MNMREKIEPIIYFQEDFDKKNSAVKRYFSGLLDKKALLLAFDLYHSTDPDFAISAIIKTFERFPTLEPTINNYVDLIFSSLLDLAPLKKAYHQALVSILREEIRHSTKALREKCIRKCTPVTETLNKIFLAMGMKERASTTTHKDTLCLLMEKVLYLIAVQSEELIQPSFRSFLSNKIYLAEILKNEQAPSDPLEKSTDEQLKRARQLSESPHKSLKSLFLGTYIYEKLFFKFTAHIELLQKEIKESSTNLEEVTKKIKNVDNSAVLDSSLYIGVSSDIDYPTRQTSSTSAEERTDNMQFPKNTTLFYKKASCVKSFLFGETAGNLLNHMQFYKPLAVNTINFSEEMTAVSDFDRKLKEELSVIWEINFPGSKL